MITMEHHHRACFEIWLRSLDPVHGTPWLDASFQRPGSEGSVDGVLVGAQPKLNAARRWCLAAVESTHELINRAAARLAGGLTNWAALPTITPDIANVDDLDAHLSSAARHMVEGACSPIELLARATTQVMDGDSA